jgi:hypothetical protein
MAPRHKAKREAFNFYSSLRLGVLVANPSQTGLPSGGLIVQGLLLFWYNRLRL